MSAVGVTIPPPLAERPIKNTVVLFDVDGTLTPARRHVSPEMLDLLSALRRKVAVGFVGGSDLIKQQEQLGTGGIAVTNLFDFCFAENGLTAYRMGEALKSNSFIKWMGEDRYKTFVKFDLDIPFKRGTFIEFRNGMVNISPVGRNCSTKERDEYEKFDLEHKVRATMIEAIKKQFPDLDLVYSIGGQISFDAFPQGWDKRYCLQHIEAEKGLPDGVEYKTIHFFGDKTFKGGNDFEIYEDPRTIGHSVKSPDDTMAELKKLFEL